MALRLSKAVSGSGYIKHDGGLLQTGLKHSVDVSLYVQVRSITGSKHEILATVFFINESDGSLFSETVVSFHPTLDGNNFISQAYEHMKSLPEFSDAEDC